MKDTMIKQLTLKIESDNMLLFAELIYAGFNPYRKKSSKDGSWQIFVEVHDGDVLPQRLRDVSEDRVKVLVEVAEKYSGSVAQLVCTTKGTPPPLLYRSKSTEQRRLEQAVFAYPVLMVVSYTYDTAVVNLTMVSAKIIDGVVRVSFVEKWQGTVDHIPFYMRPFGAAINAVVRKAHKYSLDSYYCKGCCLSSSE